MLARIEAERFEAGERQSEAAMLASQADLDRALADLEVSKLDLERTRRMFQDKLVSEQAYDQADAEVKMKRPAVEATRRRVAQLQAQLDSTRDDLKKTTVISPMDGVVTSLPKEEGEVVIGAQSFNPTVIMTVADLSVMECEILVDETDIRQPLPRPERGGAGGRPRGREDQGRGDGDRLLRDPARHRGHQRGQATRRRAATPGTRPRTSRSRSRSSIRRRPCARG